MGPASRRRRGVPGLRPDLVDQVERCLGGAAETGEARSIELARKAAAEAGVATRVTFEVASAQTFCGTDYDLVMTFDCLHDMGDPLGAARHVHQALARDGTWLLVEPFAADAVEDNFNPMGRLYYSASTFLCVPNGLSQEGGCALGAQAGEAAIRQVATELGVVVRAHDTGLRVSLGDEH